MINLTLSSLKIQAFKKRLKEQIDYKFCDTILSLGIFSNPRQIDHKALKFVLVNHFAIFYHESLNKNDEEYKNMMDHQDIENFVDNLKMLFLDPAHTATLLKSNSRYYKLNELPEKYTKYAGNYSENSDSPGTDLQALKEKLQEKKPKPNLKKSLGVLIE